MKSYYVYILSNWNHKVLYTGFTNDIEYRTHQHKSKFFRGFTSKYNCFKLLYYEEFRSAREAKHRERQIKRYRREWKFNLIRTMNPKWRDLYFDFVKT